MNKRNMTPGRETLPPERFDAMSTAQRSLYNTRRRQRGTSRRLGMTSKRYHCANLVVYLCAGVHQEVGDFLRAKKNIGKVKVQTEKKPTNDRKWCAVEIEFLARADEDTVAEALYAAGLAEFVHLKEDGSLHGTEARNNEYELVLCAELDKMPSVIKRACKVLRSPEIDAGVNKTCGLHVHLDMRGLDAARAYRNLVYAYDGLLTKLVPQTRVENTYCKAPETADLEDALSEDDRYRAINACALDRHTTLEVRIFAGSVNADKITQYLNIVSSIAYADKVVRRSLMTADAWQTEVGWAPNLTAWVKERAGDFGHAL